MGDWAELRQMAGNELTMKPGWKCWQPRKRRRRALREALAPSLAKGRELAWECLPPVAKLGAVTVQAAVALWSHLRSN